MVKQPRGVDYGNLVPTFSLVSVFITSRASGKSPGLMVERDGVLVSLKFGGLG